ncbi:cyclase family protein [Candidatus Nitrospira salsa]
MLPQTPILIAISMLLCASCASQATKIVDLTYAFDEHTVYWPNNASFQREDTAHGLNAQGKWYASGQFSASEHGGTHIDAPNHFASSGMSVDAIPITRLFGQAIVIDIEEQCINNPDYTLTIADIQEWEEQFGRIEAKTLVLLRTGWGKFWPETIRYLGSPTPDDPTTLHFPGFSGEAIKFLVHQRHIRGVGIDTASIDAGQSRDFAAHRVLSEANRYALENVASLQDIPPRGATVYALPMKIKHGTGGPVRILAIIPSR